MINRIIGLLLLIYLSPFFLVIALIILIDDGFPIFFRQKRIGVDNIEFFIYKFRTMRKSIPDIPTHLVDGNQQLYTRIGPLFRKYSIDELPQLINIIKGDMIFIGPRPALYNQDDLIEFRTQAGIHTQLPGITGWAQVNGRNAISWDEKFKLDVWYVENQSLWLDIKILFKTIPTVLKGTGQ